MTLFGSQSKGERMRIKTRVRAAMRAQTAIQGRFLGGPAPLRLPLGVIRSPAPAADVPVVRLDRVGGLIHKYAQVA
jgi:hypothetical protein